MIRFIDFNEAKAWVKHMIHSDFQQEVLAKIDSYFDTHGEFAFS